MAKMGVRMLVLWSVVGLLLAMSIGAVSAAGPAKRACIGKDVSGMARASGSGFGGFVSDLAVNTGGVGDEVLAHMAGEIPGTSCAE